MIFEACATVHHLRPRLSVSENVGADHTSVQVLNIFAHLSLQEKEAERHSRGWIPAGWGLWYRRDICAGAERHEHRHGKPQWANQSQMCLYAAIP